MLPAGHDAGEIVQHSGVEEQVTPEQGAVASRNPR